ncbi:MAG: hypothetical protein M3342_09855 [Bacteroidota bacterium]|nr:hypothetical protein [Bacteroidota bacterium]
METLTVELKHAGAKKLLKELEAMNILRIIEPEARSKRVPPSQLRGFLPKDKADALLSHVTEARNEWEERFPAK